MGTPASEKAEGSISLCAVGSRNQPRVDPLRVGRGKASRALLPTWPPSFGSRISALPRKRCQCRVCGSNHFSLSKSLCLALSPSRSFPAPRPRATLRLHWLQGEPTPPRVAPGRSVLPARTLRGGKRRGPRRPAGLLAPFASRVEAWGRTLWDSTPGYILRTFPFSFPSAET